MTPKHPPSVSPTPITLAAFRNPLTHKKAPKDQKTIPNHWRKENQLPAGTAAPKKNAWAQAAKLPWTSIRVDAERGFGSRTGIPAIGPRGPKPDRAAIHLRGQNMKLVKGQKGRKGSHPNIMEYGIREEREKGVVPSFPVRKDGFKCGSQVKMEYYDELYKKKIVSS